jgi:hypothetical protein
MHHTLSNMEETTLNMEETTLKMWGQAPREHFHRQGRVAEAHQTTDGPTRAASAFETGI